MLVSSSTKTNQVKPPVEGNHRRRLRNSDRIQVKFGSYGIDIIENDSKIRVSNLYSTHDGVKTNRTFAVVAYPAVIEPAFKKEHEAIISGQSIGVVFEHNGWTIDKHHQYFGEIEVPAEHSGVHSLFGDIGSSKPAIHIYSLLVTKESSRFEYAFIAEVHHPEFLQLEDLESIYGNVPDDHTAGNKRVNDFLEIVSTKLQGL